MSVQYRTGPELQHGQLGGGAVVELHGAAEAAALLGQGVRPAHRDNRRVVNLNNNRVGSQSWKLDGEE